MSQDWYWEDSSRRDFEDWSRRNAEESSRRLWDDWSSRFNEDSTRFAFGDSVGTSDVIFVEGNSEFAAHWATLTLKQKVVGSMCSIAVGAGGAGLLIALATFLH